MEDNKTKEEILESVRLYHNKRTNDLLEVQYNRAEHGVILKAMEVYTQQSTKQLQDQLLQETGKCMKYQHRIAQLEEALNKIRLIVTTANYKPAWALRDSQSIANEALNTKS